MVPAKKRSQCSNKHTLGSCGSERKLEMKMVANQSKAKKAYV